MRNHDSSGWTVRGELDLECGERLFVVLQAELTRDADAPLDTAAAAELREQGLDPYDPDLPSSTRPRSTRQRAHDALGNALDRYLGAELGGTTGKDAAQVIVTVPIGALEDAPGALPAVTGSGTVVPAALARHLACTSRLSRFVLDLRGMVLEASHAGRTSNRAERRAKHVETGGRCEGAGCRASTARAGTVLHPHHVIRYALCGTTTRTDTVLLCTSCHHDVHHGQRRLLLKDGRRLGPDGWLE